MLSLRIDTEKSKLIWKKGADAIAYIRRIFCENKDSGRIPTGSSMNRCEDNIKKYFYEMSGKVQT